MYKSFLLFGEEPFAAYALERYAEIRDEIEQMSDVEVLMYQDQFDELLQKMTEVYAFRPLKIDFTNQIVDLLKVKGPNGKVILAEYSLQVSGPLLYLGLQPLLGKNKKMRLHIVLRKNVLSFEINTHYASAELPEAIRDAVKKEYSKIKTFIVDNLYNINETVATYNEELKKLLVLLLADKLRRAVRIEKIRSALNFS